MKRIFYVLAILPLCFIGCKENAPVKEIGEEQIFHEGEQITAYSYLGKTIAVIFSNGQVSFLSDFDNTDAYLCSFGTVKEIDRIDYVPTDGWQNSVNLNVGDGYIFGWKFQHEPYYKYVRFHYIELIDKGGAKGYRIRYQTDWDPLSD